MKTAEEITQLLCEPYPACELEFKTKPYAAIYIDARTPVTRLNRVLPGGWEFRLAGEPRRDRFDNLSRDGVLVLHFPDGPREFWATGTETADYKLAFPTDGGEPVWAYNNTEPKCEKGADSDAFKRACFKAGMGTYIYELPKELKGNALTKEQVELAARLSGYDGEILPKHYGAMNKSRAIAPEPEPAKSKYTAAQLALAEEVKEHFRGDRVLISSFREGALTRPLEELNEDQIAEVRKALAQYKRPEIITEAPY